MGATCRRERLLRRKRTRRKQSRTWARMMRPLRCGAARSQNQILERARKTRDRRILHRLRERRKHLRRVLLPRRHRLPRGPARDRLHRQAQAIIRRQLLIRLHREQAHQAQPIRRQKRTRTVLCCIAGSRPRETCWATKTQLPPWHLLKSRPARAKRRLRCPESLPAATFSSYRQFPMPMGPIRVLILTT